MAKSEKDKFNQYITDASQVIDLLNTGNDRPLKFNNWGEVAVIVSKGLLVVYPRGGQPEKNRRKAVIRISENTRQTLISGLETTE